MSLRNCSMITSQRWTNTSSCLLVHHYYSYRAARGVVSPRETGSLILWTLAPTVPLLGSCFEWPLFCKLETTGAWPCEATLCFYSPGTILIRKASFQIP